jgi:hypothetical protein
MHNQKFEKETNVYKFEYLIGFNRSSCSEVYKTEKGIEQIGEDCTIFPDGNFS